MECRGQPAPTQPLTKPRSWNSSSTSSAGFIAWAAPKSMWDLRKTAAGSRAHQDLVFMGFSRCDVCGMRRQPRLGPQKSPDQPEPHSRLKSTPVSQCLSAPEHLHPQGSSLWSKGPERLGEGEEEHGHLPTVATGSGAALQRQQKVCWVADVDCGNDVIRETWCLLSCCTQEELKPHGHCDLLTMESDQ